METIEADGYEWETVEWNLEPIEWNLEPIEWFLYSGEPMDNATNDGQKTQSTNEKQH